MSDHDERAVVLDLHRLPPEPPADLLPWTQFDRAVRRRRRQRGGLAALATAAATAAAIIIAVVASSREAAPAPITPGHVNGALIVAEYHPTRATQIVDTDLVTVSPNGSVVRQLTRGAGADTGAAVSPDGRTVAYVHETLTPGADPTSFRSHSVLRLVGIDGSNDRQVYACASFCHDLAWASNGQSLAFVDNGIRTLIAASGTVHLLCGRACVLAAAEPAWSPDGTRIAFSQRDVQLNTGAYTGPSAIFVINADGSGLRKLTDRSCQPNRPGCSLDTDPAWSPRGDLIAFSRVTQPASNSAPASESVGLPRGVFTVAPDGRQERQLWRCPTPYCQRLAPAWSPDGSLIAVHDDNLAAAFIINAMTGAATQVSTPTSGRQVAWTSAAWAPDGTKLALTFANGDAAGDVYTVNRDGSDLSELSVPNVYGPDSVLAWAVAADTSKTAIVPMVKFTGAGTQTVQLGQPPADATRIELQLTCLTPGVFGFTDGASVRCDAHDAGRSVTTYSLPIAAGQQTTTITAGPGDRWQLFAHYANDATTAWKVNADGLTYGLPNSHGTPDLIAAVATNGRQGYIYAAQLQAAQPQPTSPEQAATMHPTPVTIPVYKSDGRTVIGEFVIGSGPRQ